MENTENNISNVQSKITFLSKWHNEIIAASAIGTLIVTFLLAYFTYSSLKEVKEQRNLTYKQFVMANRPNVNIGIEKNRGLRFKENVGYIDWLVGNSGGDVEDLTYKSILFHLKSTRKDEYNVEALYVRNIHLGYLNKDTSKSIHNPISNIETLKKIKEIIRLDKRYHIIGLYVKLNYTIPAKLTVDGKSKKDSKFIINIWNVVENRFEDISESYYERTVNEITKKKFDTLKDKG